MTTRTVLPIVLALLVLAGCAGRPDRPDEAALHTRNPTLTVTWATPDTKVPPFDKVMLAPVELEFRNVPPLTGPTHAPQSSRTEYPVSEADRARMADTFNTVFREQLARANGYTLTNEPGPGVLLVKPALRDIVSRVPPDEIPGRSDIWLDSVGDATLVVDFVDAASGRTLGSASDRRTAEPVGGAGGFGAVRADRVDTGQEVRRVARRWAGALEKRVQALYFAAKPR